MLRITTETTADGQRRLLLEGRLIGPWVRELARLCLRLLREPVRLVIDMRGVSYVEARASALLMALARRQVAIEHCSAFVLGQLGIGVGDAHPRRDETGESP